MEVQNLIDLAYKQLKTVGCSGAGTLMTSLLLCLGLSGVAYFLTALKKRSGADTTVVKELF
jgi:CHASE1-domain containing sensor protein